MILVDIRQQYGWHCHTSNDVTLWFKGYVYGLTVEDLARQVAGLSGTEQIEAYLHALDGHFAFVAEMKSGTLAAVDRIRSIPLLYAQDTKSGTWHLDDQARRLADTLSFGPGDVNLDGSLAIAMAGYTIDRDTLYRDMQQLSPGDYVYFENQAKSPPRVGRYYMYAPWRGDAPKMAATVENLASVTLEVFQKLIDSANGRTIAIPLSAGLDSRLVVSALCHLNYPHIKCFSYGRGGNFEAKTAERVAQHLGVPWRFVNISHAAQREALTCAEHQDYLRFADSASSVPFKQDFLAMKVLKEDGWLAEDAIMVNGNSGDFITGGHVAKDFWSTPKGLAPEHRQGRIIKSLLKKHFSLWGALKTKENKNRMAARMLRELEDSNVRTDDPAHDYGIYEYSEFNNRQCKYVVAGQRIYEFFGHTWRLPLWDVAYLDFWEHAPLEAKREQGLYREMLIHENWGGVWKGIPANKKTIRPLWILPIRFLFKALHAPFGRERWHLFERRFFYYWMDTLFGFAPYSYGRVARDKRDARHAIAWYAEDYLNDHGLGFDGTPKQNT